MYTPPSVETMGLVGMDCPSGDDGIEGRGRASCRQRLCGAPCRPCGVTHGSTMESKGTWTDEQGPTASIHFGSSVCPLSRVVACQSTCMHGRRVLLGHTGIQFGAALATLPGRQPFWSSRWVQSYMLSPLNIPITSRDCLLLATEQVRAKSPPTCCHPFLSQLREGSERNQAL
jgi:hypothetical protein